MRKNKIRSLTLYAIISTIMFSILSTIYPMRANAKAADAGKYAIFVRSEKGYEFAKYPDYEGDKGSREILNSHYSVMCCAHGTSVAGYDAEDPIKVYRMNATPNNGEPSEDIDGVEVTGIAAENIKKAIKGEEVVVYTNSEDGVFGVETGLVGQTPPGYNRVGHGEAEEDYLETWIIANIDEENEDRLKCGGNPTQLAWWCTPSGFKDQYGEENKYYQSALKFKEYITKVSTGKYRTEKYYEDYTGYDITPPSWKDTKPVVSYHPADGKDKAYYLIGPYAFENYKYMNDGDNLHVDFCKANSIMVKTDKSNGYVEAKKSKDDTDGDRNLLIVSKEIDKNGNEIFLQDVNFPDDGKNFYIKMYDEGRFKDSTSIKDIKIEFRYVNAWAYFDFLEGDQNLYDMIETVTYNEETGLYEHKLVAKRRSTDVQSQTLTTSAQGLYWFEYYELHRGTSINTSKINVIKKVIDSDGNVIDSKYLDEDKFDFELKVDGARSKASNPYEQKITVSTKNPSAESYVYYWEDNNNTTPIPTFTLKETARSNNKHTYKFVKAEKVDGDKTIVVDSNGMISGKLDGGTINLYVYNVVAPKQGYIKIKKEIQDKDTGVYGQTKNVNRTFKFNITVSGDFYYGIGANKNHYSGDNKLVVNDFEVTVNANELSAERIFNDENMPIYWYGEAPTVYIEELDSAGFESAEQNTSESKKYEKSAKLVGTDVELDEAGNMKFKLVEESNVTNLSKLTFKNKDVVHKSAKIKIIKKVSLEGKTEKERALILSAIKKLTFRFKVEIIEGENAVQDGTVELKGTSAKVEGNEIVMEEIYDKVFEWIGDTAPGYRITEIDVPAGTEFVSAEPNGNTEQHSASGVLREGATSEETIDNTVINKIVEHKGKIKVEKIFGSQTDKESKEKIIEALANGGKLIFNVDISGEFLYGGVNDPAESIGETISRSIRLIGEVTSDGFIVNNYILLGEDGNPVPRTDGGEISDEEKSIVMKEISISTEGEGTEPKYSKNTAESLEIVWYGENAPSYTISEDISKLGIEVIKPRDVEGRFEDSNYNAENPSVVLVDVIFNNTVPTPDLRYANLKIDKKLLGSEGLNIEDYKNNNYKFKFIVNVFRMAKGSTEVFQNPDEKDKVIYIDGVQVGENSMEWIWNGENENDLIYWNPEAEETPYVTVDEVLEDAEYKLPNGITFDSANILIAQGGETPAVDGEYMYYGKVNDKKVQLVKKNESGEETEKIPLKDLEDSKKVFTVVCNFNNKLNGPETKTSKLKIVKKVAGSKVNELITTNDVDRPFKFEVKIIAEHGFKYQGDTYASGTYYLDSEKGIVAEADKGSVKPVVTIRVTDTESKIKDWTSDEFIWNNELEGKLDYEVEEKNFGDYGCDCAITNKTGSLKQGGGEITAEATNSKDIKYGSIKLIKKVSKDEITREIAEKRVFTFDINVDGYASPIRTTLDKDVLTEEGNDYKWEKTLDDIVLKQDDSGAVVETKAQIQEVNVPEGFRFVEFTAEGKTETQNSITVVLKEGASVVEVTCRNEVVESKVMKGRIIIHKNVSIDSLKDQEFKFTVELKGTSFKATYGSEKSGDSYTSSYTFNNVKVTSTNEAVIDVEWPEGMPNPEYEVKEATGDNYELKDIKNNKGTVPGVSEIADATPSTTTTVTATNGAKEEGGYIKFRKVVRAKDTFGNNALNDVRVDDEFSFKVEISYDNGATKETIATPTIKQNEVWVSNRITWNKGNQPKYYITEINKKAGDIVEGEVDGALVPIAETPEDITGDGFVTITNVREIQFGKFKVDKHIIADLKLIDDAEMPSFEFKATIKGKFSYKNVYYDNTGTDNKELTFNFTLESTDPKDVYSTFELPENIYWATEAAPTVYIEEINVKSPWNYKGISGGAKTGASLIHNETIGFVATNSLSFVEEKVFKINLGGTVWEDEELLDNKNDKRSKDGHMGADEKRIEDVEVYIYEGNEPADLRDITGVVIQQPIYTDSNGNWKAEGIKIPDVVDKKYSVEFVYDGQTYEPTKFLASYGNMKNSEKAKEYMNSSTKREDYIDNSMALDKNREEVDNRINEVYGYSAITGDGKTVGEVKSVTGATAKINYQANIADLDTYGKSGNKVESLKSKLQTRDSSGKLYDVFKAVASTNTVDAQLLFPASKALRIDKHTRVIEERDQENVIIDRTEYVYTGTYLEHINLGLVKRPEAGLMTTKKLASANVVTRNGVVHYEFKKLTELINDNGVIKRELKGIDVDEDKYTYGKENVSLYAPDYYYREEIYNNDPNYSAFANRIANTEMEIYLNYVMTVVNESSQYKVKINSINDYFDSTLEIVNDTIGIDNKIDANRIYNDKGRVIDNPTFNISEGTKFTNGKTGLNGIEWKYSGNDIMGSDGKSYSKVTADLGDKCILSPAGNTLSDADTSRLDMYVTLKVKRDKLTIIENNNAKSIIMAIATGNKSNVVEVANYSTMYEDSGKNAGKIDSDSAADNINISSYNEKYWYEDDTYAAPRLELTVERDSNKVVNGKAWEDNSLDNDGLGQRNEDSEALIGGLTTQLVEMISVGDEVFGCLMPTNQPLDDLGGLTFKEVTGFDSSIETAREGDVGSYSFTGMPSGDYITRFRYGNDKTQLEDTEGITGNPVALNSNGELFNKVVANGTDISGLIANGALGSTYTLTANYSAQDNDNAPAVYNGQDYKTTIYRYDGNADGSDNNDARDNEDNRLRVMAKSTTISNYNSEVLAEANKAGGHHDELYRDYEMSADTENVVFTPVVKKDTETLDEARYIDVGLVERPKNDVVIDKEIKAIKIITNDNKTIFDAEYGIEYKVVDNVTKDDEKILSKFFRNGRPKYLVANVSLDKQRSINHDVMQELNKREDKRTDYDDSNINPSVKNFRFINVDEDILQGSTITIEYKFTAINVGEQDYTSKEIAELSSGFIKDGDIIKTQECRLYELADEVKVQKSKKNSGYVPGSILGEYYYTGATKDSEGNDLPTVASRIRQMVDYTDADATFETTNNDTRDSSWKNGLVAELAGNGLSKERLVSKSITKVNRLYDKNDRTYMNESKNNIVLSIDEIETKESNFDNSGFEKELVPVGDSIESDANTSELFLTVTRTVSSQDDADNLTFDNVAEVVKAMNTVGRRNINVVVGNANPKFGEFEVALKEKDSSATELVTFTPPTGIDMNTNLMNQVIIITTVALMIVGAGVIVIKRTMM